MQATSVGTSAGPGVGAGAAAAPVPLVANAAAFAALQKQEPHHAAPTTVPAAAGAAAAPSRRPPPLASPSATRGGWNPPNKRISAAMFEKEDETELSLAEGEVLELVSDMGDGWSDCRNERGETGFVPSSYLFEVAPEAP